MSIMRRSISNQFADAAGSARVGPRVVAALLSPAFAACLGLTVGAQQMLEFDGTLTAQVRGAVTIRDSHCRYHNAALSTASLYDGHPLSGDLHPPFNAHFVVNRTPYGTEGVVSIQRRAGPGAPRSCESYSPVRTQEGFLRRVFTANPVGAVEIVTDTGDDISFPISSANVKNVTFNRHAFQGCFDWPRFRCDQLAAFTPRTRVRIRYAVVTDADGRYIKLISIETVGSR